MVRLRAAQPPAGERPDIVITAAETPQLAAAYREHLAAQGTIVIAVAGSNGKTTTRHLIHTALAATLPGSQSPKSFNNHIGVPLTLLRLRRRQ